MNLGKLCCDVIWEIFYNFPNIYTPSLNFHHLHLINFSNSISKDQQNMNVGTFKQTNTSVFCCNAWKIILILSSSWLHSKTFVTLLEILNISFSLLASVGNRWFYKIISTEIVTNKLRRCCLFLMLWKNANHSLFDSIFYSNLCKCTRVSDCPRLSLEQFLALVPQYISCTYFINNGFKLPLGQNELYNSLKLFFVPLNSLLLLSNLLHILFT